VSVRVLDRLGQGRPGLDVAGAEVPVERAAAAPARPDQELVARLRAGDADAFGEIVRDWTPVMLHVARAFVSSHASAEETVQETWLALVRGLDTFEGRSSLRTWTFRVLTNIARRQGARESRSVSVAGLDGGDVGPTVDPRRFRGDEDEWAGGWRPEAAPRAWGPEIAVLSGEIRDLLTAALASVPARQRMVLELRDIAGLSAEEVCAVLDMTAVNQRVLLHRARARVRQQLEDYYTGRGRDGS
jgi:RNA polymerase sigma-70 factor, ECF subfamily